MASVETVSVSLGVNGWAWLVSGRRLIVWRLIVEGGEAYLTSIGLTSLASEI